VYQPAHNRFTVTDPPALLAELCAHVPARKLSQNRSAADFDGVVAGLSAGSPLERAVAEDMRTESPRR
jgi:predicted FMN-binding regulatory protein PaiB